MRIVKFRIFSEFLAALASLDLTSNCIDQEFQDGQRIRSFAIWMFPESYSTHQCLFDFGVSGKDERRRFTLITVAFLFLGICVSYAGIDQRFYRQTQDQEETEWRLVNRG